MYGAPSPQALAFATFFYLVVPSILLIGIITLVRCKKRLLAGLWIFPFIAFYSYFILSWNLSTSPSRIDIVLHLIDLDGNPVTGAKVEITHYRQSNDQFAGTSTAIRQTNLLGEVSFPASWEVRTSVVIKTNEFRPFLIDLQRSFKRFPTRHCSLSWPVLKENEDHYRSNMANILFDIPRGENFDAILILPRKKDDDMKIESLNSKSINAGEQD